MEFSREHKVCAETSRAVYRRDAETSREIELLYLRRGGLMSATEFAFKDESQFMSRSVAKVARKIGMAAGTARSRNDRGARANDRPWESRGRKLKIALLDGGHVTRGIHSCNSGTALRLCGADGMRFMRSTASAQNPLPKSPRQFDAEHSARRIHEELNYPRCHIIGRRNRMRRRKGKGEGRIIRSIKSHRYSSALPTAAICCGLMWLQVTRSLSLDDILESCHWWSPRRASQLYAI